MAAITPSHQDQHHQLHLFFFPFMSPGHQIPILDLALLTASRGIKTTVITTPLNLLRFQSLLHRHGGSAVDCHLLHFPPSAALPPNIENLDSLPSRLMLNAFYRALMTLHPQADDLVRRFQPDAIVSDWNIPWTAQIARKYQIPRILFYPTSSFSVCVSHSVNKFRPHMGVNSDWETFLVPGLPEKVCITKSCIPARFFRNLGMQEFSAQFTESENYAYGTVFNTFNEIEPEYIQHYEKIRGKVWAVGPVSLRSENDFDLAERGNSSSIDREEYLRWLDSKEPDSVIYVCFGSLCVFPESQLVEIGLGLEASNCSFIWVVREGYDGLALEDLEERVKARGLIIKGWAPQLLILRHPAVGGFVTHCGWNSVLESVSCGVPIIAWPLFAEQFYNARFVLRQRIGFGIVFETGLVWGEEERAGALVKRGRVNSSVTRLMGGGEMVKEMRERVKRLGELARSAASEGGSSYVNLDLLIEDLIAQKQIRLEKGKEEVSI